METFLVSWEGEERERVGLGRASEVGKDGVVGQLEETVLGRGGEEGGEGVGVLERESCDQGRRESGLGCWGEAGGERQSRGEAVEEEREGVGVGSV